MRYTKCMATDITERVSKVWINMKRYSAMSFDRKILVKLVRKLYTMMVKLAVLNGVETWATAKVKGARLYVNEIKMLRSMCGVAKKDYPIGT